MIIATIENVLSDNLYKHVYSTLNGTNMSWQMVDDISGSTKDEKTLAIQEAAGVVDRKPMYGFGFNFCVPNAGVVNLVDFQMLYPILANATSAADIRIDEVILGRAFLTLPLPYKIDLKQGAHIDRDEPHLVCLYYLTDHQDDPSAETSFFASKDDLTIVDSYRPKANSAIIFDGQQYHVGGHPTKDKRMIINFCFRGSKNGS